MISLVVPCYNEEKALPLFYQEVTKVCKTMDCDTEIILINDGSTDRTLELMRELSEKDRRITYLSFSRNFGKEAAIYAGFRQVRGDYVAVMDADMQDPPSLLPKMLRILETGEYDSVATRREDRKGEPPIRSWFARRFYRIMNRISDSDVVDGARDFRLMKREMAEAIVSMGEANRFSKGIFGWIGFRTCWISYENIERVAGETKWNFRKLFRYALDGIIDFSQAPLLLSFLFGAGFSGVSMLAGVIEVIRKLVFHQRVQVWIWFMILILLTEGIQLICLGIQGEYVGRIFTETKHRPHYIIAESNRNVGLNR